MLCSTPYLCQQDYIRDGEVLARVGDIFYPTGYGTNETLDLYTFFNDGRDKAYLRQLSFIEFETYFKRH